jgi:hypothetical protein
MNDDMPIDRLTALKDEHGRLDERIRLLTSEPLGSQLELARLKRDKLRIKDEIAFLQDLAVPDIIA